MPADKIKVSLFATCIIDQLYPQVGVSVVNTLRRLGVDVDFPMEQTCCGPAPVQLGLYQRGEQAGGEGSSALLRATGTWWFPSGSCTAMMRVFYHDLFRRDP